MSACEWSSCANYMLSCAACGYAWCDSCGSPVHVCDRAEREHEREREETLRIVRNEVAARALREFIANTRNPSTKTERYELDVDYFGVPSWKLVKRLRICVDCGRRGWVSPREAKHDLYCARCARARRLGFQSPRVKSAPPTQSETGKGERLTCFYGDLLRASLKSKNRV